MLNNEQGQLKRAKHGLIPVYGTDSSDCRGSKNWDWEINVSAVGLVRVKGLNARVKLVSHPALVLLCVGAALQVPVQLLQRLTKLRLTSFVRLQEHGAEVDLLGQAVTARESGTQRQQQPHRSTDSTKMRIALRCIQAMKHSLYPVLHHRTRDIQTRSRSASSLSFSSCSRAYSSGSCVYSLGLNRRSRALTLNSSTTLLKSRTRKRPKS